MYITVMDYSTSSIAKLIWDVEKTTTEEVEILLETMGYDISQIAYMTNNEEPEFKGYIEISDVLPDFIINKI